MPRGNFGERSSPDLGTLPPVVTDINPTPLTICERDAAGYGRFVGVDSGSAAALNLRQNNADCWSVSVVANVGTLTNLGSGGSKIAAASGFLWLVGGSGAAGNGVLILDAGTISIRSGGNTTCADVLPVAAGASTFRFTQDTTWTITQVARASDAAPKALTVAPQTAFATATTTNRIGGPLVALLAPQTNSGGSGAEGPSLFSRRWEVPGATVLRRADIGADRVQTTDATGNVTCGKHVIPDATIEAVQIRTVCRKPSTGDSATYIREVGVKRHAGGASQQVGATATPFADNEDAALAACNVGVAFGGADYLLSQVTGIAATTLEWGTFMRSFSITP